MSHSTSILGGAARRRFFPSRWARWIFRFLVLAIRVQRERRILADLDDRRLADIGVSRTSAEAEASREFLDIPYNRRSRLYL